MKKALLAALLAAISCLAASAQKQRDSVYVSQNGTTFRVGQRVTLGLGTGTDGQFRYAVVIDYLGMVEAGKHLSGEYATRPVTITKIRRIKSSIFSKEGTTYLVFKPDGQLQVYGINVEPALLAKEVSVEQPAAKQ